MPWPVPELPGLSSPRRRWLRRARLRHSRLLLAIGAIVAAGVLLFWRGLAWKLDARVLQFGQPQHHQQPAPLLFPSSTAGLPYDSSALLTNSSAHPIYQLVQEAESDFAALRARQSQSLADAVREYRRRYGLPPPPNFEKWYAFATARRVQLIDEYDGIHAALQPFWGLRPATIRARAREAMAMAPDGAIMGMTIRGGRCVLVLGGSDWQQEATAGMVRAFARHLPDLDLAFNTHDEPRVLVPHEDLARLLARGRAGGMARAAQHAAPANAFSPRPADVGDGLAMPAPRAPGVSRFNRYAHQFVWLPSRLPCPPDSPARALDVTDAADVAAADALGEYARAPLGFVANGTAFTDICLTPSLRETYGFFERPNAFDVVHELFPIFSQSKLSSFQDILYPSPWYWSGKVPYDEAADMEWEAKANQLYWRGSTTGGFSRSGGWRRQHRQRTVQRINALDTTFVLERSGGKQAGAGAAGAGAGAGAGAAAGGWQTKSVRRPDYRELFNVKFSHVGQCDPNDCDAQREFFEVVEPAKQQAAWGWKHLLDMDGNAFSGRFYAFLRSRSLVYKLAMFREWHQEWLRPWVHFVPLSLRGDEYVESVRYFARDDAGQAQARRIAMQSRDWAQKALRNEDLEVWFFRLLLEYARVIDDQRESIGYHHP